MDFKPLENVSHMLRVLGAAALMGMMLLTVADVVGRLFKAPIFGSVEVVEFLAAILVTAALPYTYRTDGHVGVEILVRLLPKKQQLSLSILTRLISLALFGLITWQMFLYAQDIRQTGEVSMNLEFPVHYIVYLLSAGLLIFSATILVAIFNDILHLRKRTTK